MVENYRTTLYHTLVLEVGSKQRFRCSALKIKRAQECGNGLLLARRNSRLQGKRMKKIREEYQSDKSINKLLDVFFLVEKKSVQLNVCWTARIVNRITDGIFGRVRR